MPSAPARPAVPYDGIRVKMLQGRNVKFMLHVGSRRLLVLPIGTLAIHSFMPEIVGARPQRNANVRVCVLC